MQWWARGEVTTTKAKPEANAEEVCVTVTVLEPTEGNESTNCGQAGESGFEQVEQTEHSSYGVVAAAMYAPEAKRVLICIKGGSKLNVRLRQIRLRSEAGAPTRSYSYFARGFRPATRIEWINPLDAHGRVVTGDSRGRRCG
jgi:hypothetical protein